MVDLKKQYEKYMEAVDLYHRLFPEPDASVSDIAEKLVDLSHKDIEQIFGKFCGVGFLISTRFGDSFYFNISCLGYSYGKFYKNDDGGVFPKYVPSCLRFLEEAKIILPEIYNLSEQNLAKFYEFTSCFDEMIHVEELKKIDMEIRITHND
ncbi:MAG: hypothetical protein ACLFUO_02520 [Candidatus Woesearchaeota archaeon]